MDLDDFDDLDLGGSKPSHVPGRVTRFLPKSSVNKSAPKPEPEHGPQQPDVSILKKLKTEENLVPTTTGLTPKAEPSDFSATVAVEVKPVPEAEVELRNDGPMDLSGTNIEPDSGEDVIVREIDVFFNPSIDAYTQLFVVQYPLRPSWRPYELDERCQEVRVKRSSSVLEMDLSVDVDSSNWDTEKASRMNMSKQTLHCSWTPSAVTCYAVGVLMGNKLHLNPINAVPQLRPSMLHLNCSDSKKRNNVSGNTEVLSKEEDCRGDMSGGPMKKQNQRAGPPLEQNPNDGEGWIPLTYYGSNCNLSERYLQRMLAQDHSPIHFGMSKDDYLNALFPGASNKTSKFGGPSKSGLLLLALEGRLKTLLREGPPALRFNAIKHYAPDASADEIFNVLHKIALLVQGFWVLRSGEVITDDKQTCFARDFVLRLFRRKSVVKVEETLLPGKVQDAINRYLNIFAIKRPSLNDWKFKEATDMSFIKQYPHVVEKQNQIWIILEGLINNALNKNFKKFNTRNTTATSVQANKPSESSTLVKDAVKGASEMVTENRSVSNEVREALAKAFQKLFQTHKVCSKQFIRQGLRDMAVSRSTLPKADAKVAVLAAGALDTEEFEEVLNETATNIHGLYVLKSSPEHPEHNQLRNIVIDLLLAGGPNAKLKKADIVAAAKVALLREVAGIEYNKVMGDLCEYRGSAWVLKSGDVKPK